MSPAEKHIPKLIESDRIKSGIDLSISNNGGFIGISKPISSEFEKISTVTSSH
jgi:hypothetical protein